MKVSKKKICELNRCYSIAPLKYHGDDCFLTASEKRDDCYVFSAEGEKLETVWKEPGGVMSMIQVPGSDGQFLATHQFYSPNDSKEAKIVTATPAGDGNWEIQTLSDAPFVHRIGILSRGQVSYLLACCLKSGHEYEDDWRYAGAVYVAELPDDLSQYNEGNQLELRILKDGLFKNHGYSTYVDDGTETAVIGCESGIYQLVPPVRRGADWEVRKLVDEPSSDAVLLDFDWDGKPEIGSIAPFHGDTLHFYRQAEDGSYKKEWTCPTAYEFLHATWTCMILGRPAWVVGHREGKRESMLITWEDGAYNIEVFDSGAGAANACMLGNGSLVVTNREINEIAVYQFE